MKQNKKGFTLVELLAIIIVIAVISLISIPIITNIMEKSRIEAFKSSLYQLFNSVQYYMEEKGLDTFPEDGIDVKELNLYKETTLTMGIVLNQNDKYYLEDVSNGKYCGTGTKRNLIVYKGKCDASIPACSLKIDKKYVGDNKWYGVRPIVTMETSAAKASGLSYGIGYVENYSKSIKTSKRGTATFDEVKTGVTEVNCYVKTGSENKGTNKIEVKVDETAPTEADFNYTTTSNSITVVANGTDNESGIARYQFSIDDGNNWYPTVPQKSNVYTFDKLSNKTTYPVRVAVYNGTYTEEKKLSNYKESAAKQVTLVSLLGPTYEVEGGWKNTNKSAKILFTGEGTYLFMVDIANVTANVDLNNCGPTSQEGKFNCSNEVIAKNTVLEVDIWYRTTTNPTLSFPENGGIIAKTADGVNSEQSTQNINEIDKESPTCVSSGGSTTWYNTNRTIYGTCSDTGGSGCEGNISTTYIKTGESANQSPGTVKDAAGNSTTCPANQLVRIDKESPTCVTSSSHPGWINQDVTLTGTCSDTGGSGCVGNISKKYTSGINQNQSPGTVKDNAGNSTTCPTKLVQIDKTPPTCATTSNYPDWTNQNVKLTGTCSDTGGSGCAGNISATYSQEGLYNRYPAANQSSAFVKDNANNQGYCPSLPIKIDKTPPTQPEFTMFQSLIGWAWYSIAITKSSVDVAPSTAIPADATASISSVKGYEVYPTGMSNTWSVISDPGGLKSTIHYGYERPFNHNVVVRAVDKAGNYSINSATLNTDPILIWIYGAYQYCLKRPYNQSGLMNQVRGWYSTGQTNIATAIYGICTSAEAKQLWQGMTYNSDGVSPELDRLYRGVLGRPYANNEDKGEWKKKYDDHRNNGMTSQEAMVEMIKYMINGTDKTYEFQTRAATYNLKFYKIP